MDDGGGELHYADFSEDLQEGGDTDGGECDEACCADGGFDDAGIACDEADGIGEDAADDGDEGFNCVFCHHYAAGVDGWGEDGLDGYDADEEREQDAEPPFYHVMHEFS